jgi:hypothetical protein
MDLGYVLFCIVSHNKPVADVVDLIRNLVFLHAQRTKEYGEPHLPPSLQHQLSPYQSSLQFCKNKTDEVNANNQLIVLLLIS